MEYPLNVNETIYFEELTADITKLSDLAESGNWADVIEMLESHRGLINVCRLPKVNCIGQLVTPLHQAAYRKAPIEVFEKILSFRASKTLKTADGKTAHDIAVENGLDEDILKLIEVPAEIKQRAAEIEIMEKKLHKVINKRAKAILKANNQALPQLAYLYEFGTLWYPIPGWYGGFDVEEHEKGIQTKSFIRILGGSGQRHVIKRSGKVKLVEKGFY